MVGKGENTIGKDSIFIPTETLDDFDLGGIHCEQCNDKGYLLRVDEDGVIWSRECPCMKKRRTQRSIRKSGVSDMLSRYTFDRYIADTPERVKIKALAKKFSEEDKGWLIISGRSGSGKSHICGAICGELIERGNELRYFAWREDSVKLKSIVNTPEYQERIKCLTRVQVLYIDDFFKGTVTDADINLAFQILNGRYIDSRKRTIISTELSMENIFSIDEALGGRILERSAEFRIKSPDENYRLRMI
jgi:DNA replication protein DnaC